LVTAASSTGISRKHSVQLSWCTGGESEASYYITIVSYIKLI
jgi:hypothetical protein